jgi:alpha-maltose-1-phosphate synthase
VAQTVTVPSLPRRAAARSERLGSVLVACPDARPPAYQAVVGLARAGLLDGFVTGFYYGGRGPLTTLGRQLVPCHFARWRRTLKRRHHPQIPAERVHSVPSFDLALACERRLGGRPGARGRVARWRARRFDRLLARAIKQRRPEAVLVFSDVGSEFALPLCRDLGIPAVLSMVHGDVREERRVLEEEARLAPDFFRLYLGDAPLDRDEMDWLHGRRLRDVALADRVLVPSEHIAAALASHGTPRERIAVVPYAADTRRFRPVPNKRHDASCTFLFAGGVSQRKGIKYLLEAWRRVRRPGWRLQLLGPLPRDPGPLAPYLGEVESLGRLPHAEVPKAMAAADVFVFPSLFEGSAVVTYEALACGLPNVVTPAAGSVVRDGVEGFVVPVRDVEALAGRMERLGTDPPLRAAMSAAARARAEQFDWPRYHAAVVDAVRSELEV